jgi:putative tricarboxylic transport membrane protein
MFFALTAVGSLTGRSMAKGIMSAVLGLMIATIGIDLQTGQPRFTMGIVEFQDGVSLLVVIVGMFALSEVLLNVEKLFRGELKPIRIKGKLWLTMEEWRRSIKPILRGGTIGFLVGVLPGGGGTIATILAYATEKKLSKTPHRFGKGAVEGVAAPEAANNAATCGAFVPMLTLGVPGSGTTAVLLAAFIMFGFEPGPLLFLERPDLVWGLIDSMYLGNIILLVLNLPLVPVFARILYLPPGVLLTLILGIAVVGVFTINNSILDLYVLMFFGALGYGFRKLDVPVAPLILALVLGGNMEQSFRQAMTISDANPIIFVSSTICVVLSLLSLLSLLSPLFTRRLRKMAPVVEKEET